MVSWPVETNPKHTMSEMIATRVNPCFLKNRGNGQMHREKPKDEQIDNVKIRHTNLICNGRVRQQKEH